MQASQQALGSAFEVKLHLLDAGIDFEASGTRVSESIVTRGRKDPVGPSEVRM